MKKAQTLKIDTERLEAALERAERFKSKERVRPLRGEELVSLASGGGTFELTKTVNSSSVLRIGEASLSIGEHIELAPWQVAQYSRWIGSGVLLPVEWYHAYQASQEHSRFIGEELQPLLSELENDRRELRMAHGLEVSARAQLENALRIQEARAADIERHLESLDKLLPPGLR